MNSKPDNAIKDRPVAQNCRDRRPWSKVALEGGPTLGLIVHPDCSEAGTSWKAGENPLSSRLRKEFNLRPAAPLTNR
jgi:hypothetical protein